MNFNARFENGKCVRIPAVFCCDQQTFLDACSNLTGTFVYCVIYKGMIIASTDTYYALAFGAGKNVDSDEINRKFAKFQNEIGSVECVHLMTKEPYFLPQQ